MLEKQPPKETIGTIEPPAGFEPATHGIEAHCSNPLSYGGIGLFLTDFMVNCQNHEKEVKISKYMAVVAQW